MNCGAGLTIDNLVAATVLLADGSIVQTDVEREPDLFWAIRGGGGNFGIAASLEFDLHPVGPIITGGLAAHPFPKGSDVLKFFRDTCGSAPDEMMLAAGMLTAPDGSGAKLVGILAAANLGHRDQARRPSLAQPRPDAHAGTAV